MALFILLAIIIISLIISSVEIVAENTIYVIELFGKFTRIMTPGLNFRFFIFERVAEKVTLRQQNFTLTGRYPSKDKQTIDITTNLIFAVIPSLDGVRKYTYVLVDRDRSFTAAIENSLRTYIAREDYEGILQKKEELTQHIRQDLEAQFKDWGINIVSFQLMETHLKNISQ